MARETWCRGHLGQVENSVNFPGGVTREALKSSLRHNFNYEFPLFTESISSRLRFSRLIESAMAPN